MQINRLFEIVCYLMNKGGIIAKELAERFEENHLLGYRNPFCGNISIYMTKGKAVFSFIMNLS